MRGAVSEPSALPSKTELFELIVESATDFAIFTIDQNGITTTWNIGAERLFGYSEAEMLGSSADRIFTPEDQAGGFPDLERKQARISGRANDERWHQRRDGRRFWASGLMMPLNHDAGFVKITRDRSAQHAAEEHLRENEARFRLLATSIPQMVFQTRATGDRTWGSPQWVDFTGLDIEASVGQGWIDAVHPDDREVTRDGWRRAVETGEYDVEHRIRRAKDGEYRWHQTRANPLDKHNPATSEWVGTSTDIHHLRGLQDRQQMLLAELQHRTRNLLAVVGSIASRTARTSGSLDQFREDFQSRLRSLSAIQSLLARGEQEVIDLRELVDAELFAHLNGSVTDKADITGPPVPLGANAAQALGLALHELTTNAVKYGALSQPSGRLAVRWSTSTTGSEPAVLLEWEESGVTMAEAEHGRKGYGRELIERALPYQLAAKTKFELRPRGVYCAIAVPMLPQANQRDG
jgi:PAS domain S-box-containing protein